MGSVIAGHWLGWVIAGLLLLILPQIATAQPVDSLLAQAHAAFENGDYDKSRTLFEQVSRQDRPYAEAQYMLARLYLKADDMDRSKQAIRQALRLDSDDPRYLSIRLMHRHLDPSTFLPPLQRERRRLLARKILRLDSTNAMAHVELGSQHTDDFLVYDQAKAVRAAVGGCRSRFDVACLEEQGAVLLDQSAAAVEAYPQAERHLQQAVASDPTLKLAYKPLLQLYATREDFGAVLPLLDTMTVHLPDELDTWLYRGWAHYRTDAFAQADADFKQAFALMVPRTKHVFEDLRFILHEDEEDAYAQDTEAYARRFWAGKDPRLLSDYNERRLEHYARLVHADILYGAPRLDRRGWEMDRGRIFLRYGLPEQRYVIRSTTFHASDTALGSSAGRESSFMIWYYDGFWFVFENPLAIMNNDYRLYSPSPREYASLQTVIENNDSVIRAREVAREEPERSQYEPPEGRAALPYLASAFKGQDGKADLYVPYGVPANLEAEDTVETGLFLLNSAHTIVAEQRGTARVGSSTEVDVDSSAFWLHTAHLSATAGTYDVDIEFETADGAIAGYERQSFTLPSFTGEALRVSDVMPALLVEDGTSNGPGLITRHGYTITAVPGSVFERTQPLYLYFEMYNLAQEANGSTGYALEAVLVPAQEEVGGVRKVWRSLFGGGEKGGVAVGFEGTGTRPDEAHYLIMDVKDQPPGRYRLVLHVRDTVSGATVETSRDITLE
ncbi:MAG TPA: GWxTD domain-containing protein [Rhodothermales bacterium]|nr:GWxTD domain-containing protein [Rhodothermales bacterium]